MAIKTIKLTFDGKEDAYYSLASTCKVLDKARSTLMRLLKSWEAVTGSKPQRDHSGRWYLSVKSVRTLSENPKLYLKLAGRATKWEDEKASLQLRTKCLEADVKTLLGIIQENVSATKLKKLKQDTPLLKNVKV